MRAMRSYAWLSYALFIGGCADAETYIGEGKLYQVALTPETVPALETEEGGLYVVETHAEVPIRPPTASELSALQAGVSRYPGLPFPRLPWVEREDFGILVDFSLSNLDDTTHDIDVIINGVNEFFEYVPGVIQQEDEEPLPLHSQWEKRYRLSPKQRIAITVREEDLDEMAVDLATVVNGAPNSDQIVYFENKSYSDPRSKPYIPKVIPGLTGLRLGLRSTAAGNVLLEASVRVRDAGEKLAEDGEPRMQLMPQPFESVVPET
jgi:hypothetical protein